VADGDLRARLDEVELQDLPGAVGGALVAARRGEAGADLAQVVAEDRLGAAIAGGGNQLHDPRCRQAGIAAQKLFDLALEGIELRSAPGSSLIVRRPLGAKRRPDRVPCQAGAPGDLLDRHLLDEVHPPDLRPLLHSHHSRLLTSIRSDRVRLEGPSDAPAAGRGGSVLDRREGGQYSGGAYNRLLKLPKKEIDEKRKDES
jgi:hypothetical protein